ncbi:transcription elongation factor GreB [Halobacteriovorax marinus]|uniref:Transcription elongation factor GreA n=1 Tax=Halobacteriovorax marinus TaxID=97084 RepID=A0A1Y5FCD9_9BACT|nr:transcription elongation factor GreB [Halobacteriovorax marinus]
MTPKCHQKMSEELEYLLKVERPETTRVIAWAAGNGDRSENADYIYGKKRLREIDRRLRFLKKRLNSSKIIDPITMNSVKIQFSSTVLVEYENGEQKLFSIVGVDEVDTEKGHLSWRSPVGKALLGKEVGDVVMVKAPKGEFELEVVELSYREIS